MLELLLAFIDNNNYQSDNMNPKKYCYDNTRLLSNPSTPDNHHYRSQSFNISSSKSSSFQRTPQTNCKYVGTMENNGYSSFHFEEKNTRHIPKTNMRSIDMRTSKDLIDDYDNRIYHKTSLSLTPNIKNKAYFDDSILLLKCNIIRY